MSFVLLDTFSLPGAGKTTDAIYSCAGGTFFVRDPAQLRPGKMVVGYEPKSVRIAKDIAGVTATLEKMRKDGDVPTFVVVDDLTVLLQHYLTRVEPSFPKEGDGVYRLWGHMADVTFRFATACRDLGCHVVCTSHVRPPDDAIRGGPKVPSKQQTERFCTEFTHVLLVGHDERRPSEWKGIYICEPGGSTWITKDRDGVFQDKSPMNIAEHMRFAGYDWPRPPGFEWMEDWVEEVAASIEAGGKRKEVAEALAKELTDVDPLHLRWIRRDGFDRAEIRAAYRARIARP